MPKFRYVAVDASGRRTRGIAEAESPLGIADGLRGQRCFLLRAEEVAKAGVLLEFLHTDLSFTRGLSKATVASFTRELSVMLQAGQDIDHALRFLVETTEQKRAREILAIVRDQVRGGKSLAAALAGHPLVFSRLYISLVQAGETGGSLADSLAQLADLLEREAGLAASIRTALTYPILLGIVSVGTIVLLLTYVLPQFTPIFLQAGAELPGATRALIGIGEAVRIYGAAIFVGLLCALLAAHRSLRQPAVRLVVERFVSAAPVVGVLTQRVQAARFTRTLGSLLRNGVGLVAALGIGHDVLGSLMAARGVERAIAKVKSGGRVAAALAAEHVFPLQTIHLLQLGEETGKLAEMTLRAADIHDDQVRHTVQRMVSLLVPCVTIVMGVIVAGIVASLLAAMLSLNDLAL